MGWIVLTVLCGIVFWVAVGYALLGGGLPGWGVAALVAVVWVGVSLAMSFHTVGQREVAIVYNFSGTISGKKDAGVVNTMPWQHIKKENIGILHDEFVFDADNAAVSIDQQKITALISINYQIEPQDVVDLYKRVGPGWKKIIVDARVPQDFKEVTATYTTPELTKKREQLRLDTKKKLIAELAPYDIKVVDVFVRNLGFSQSYTDSIERKQKQVQDALTAQAKIKQVEYEASQKVAAANGEANAQVAEARGEATANRLRSASLTQKILLARAIDKLNPNVQYIFCASPQTFCVPNTGALPGVTK